MDEHRAMNSSSPDASTLADHRSSLGDGADLEKGLSPADVPQVGPNGSVAPAPGSGLPPARSEAEEIQEKADEHKSDADWEVKWEAGEAGNPLNWPMAKKCWLTFASGILVLNASFASSAPSATVAATMADLGISDITVGTLVVSIFVLGYCFGPLAWGPLSETYGRRWLFVIAFAIYTCFNIGCAVSPNMTALLFCRFLAGVCASNPMTNSGGIVGDIWAPAIRGTALSAFVVGPFAGPALGPIVGGYMTVAGVHWSWIYWVLTIFSFICLVVILAAVPETYGPLLLSHKAKRLRAETGQPWWAPLERKKSGIKARLSQTLVGPFKMLAEEPMLLSITLYMSFIYGVLYLDFVAYPIIFEQGHGMNAGSEGLMFLPLFIGACLAALVNVFYYNPRYIKKSSAYPPWQAPPELRLDSALVGAFFIPLSIFWLSFTSYPSIHWAVPMMSGLFMGAGLILVFLSLFSYIIDTYLYAAATALAATTVIRSLFGMAFPLFARQMYTALNPRFAGLILALITCLFVPIPLLFLKFGPKIRSMSKNAAKK